MKILTKNDYSEIVFLKNLYDHIQEEEESIYDRIKQVLYIKDDDWINDYMNGEISFLDMISHYGIEIK